MKRIKQRITTVIKQLIAAILCAAIIIIAIKAGSSFHDNIDIEPIWTITSYLIMGIGVGFICILIAEFLKINSDR